MKRLAFSILTLIILVGLVSAMPPSENLDAKIKSGQIKIPNHNPDHKAEPYNFNKVSLSSEVVLKDKSLVRKYGTKATTRSYKQLVILVDFSDKPSQIQPAFFDNLIFSETGNSVRKFYYENSYGNLDLVTVNLPSSLGWARASQPITYYTNGAYGMGAYPNNAQKLLEDLIKMVDPVVNFADYDNDGNGYVDTVAIVHAGRGAEYSGNTGDFWSLKWAIYAKRYDNVWVQDFSLEPEYWNSPNTVQPGNTFPGDMTIGVFAHEFGHGFGLPDLYSNSGKGIGKWSVMAGGAWNGALGSSPAHFDAWSKTKLGFASPQIISNSPTTVNIPNAENNPIVYKLWKDNSFGKEYFLMENRQKIGYDNYLPGSGLLVYHVDDNITNGNIGATPWYPGRDASKHYEVALEQADGLWEMEKNIDLGDGADPFPGTLSKKSFTLTTTPNSGSYLNGESFVKIEDISDSASTMTAKLSAHTTTPPGDTTPPSVSISSPQPNPYLVGNVSVSASASDDIGISKVEFYINNNLLSSDNDFPYGKVINTGSYFGRHDLTVKAYDTSGNLASSTLSVDILVCGDMDYDGKFNRTDTNYLSRYVFEGGLEAKPFKELGDINSNQVYDIIDVSLLINYLSRNGPAPLSCNKAYNPPSPLKIMKTRRFSLTFRAIEEIRSNLSPISKILVVGVLSLVLVYLIANMKQNKGKKLTKREKRMMKTIVGLSIFDYFLVLLFLFFR